MGTESAVDDSKSIKTYLMMLFEEAGNTDVEVRGTPRCAALRYAALCALCRSVDSAPRGRDRHAGVGGVALGQA